jgi:3'-phosphoadenosine 5'-phosphosulfate sulfotransferase (PAPS reductase)/FAD synthetase
MATGKDDGLRATAEEMDDLESDAIRIIVNAVRQSGTAPVTAYSGGKDGLVAGILAARLGYREAICETSFTIARQRVSMKQIAARHGMNVTYRWSLDDAWLAAQPELIFSSDAALRSRSFARRQQRTVRIYAKERGAQCVIFGRRTEENTVKAPIYDKGGVIQCHPIRNWKLHHVWTFFERHGIERPWIYSTRFGKTEGSAAFYALRAEDVGGHRAAWALVRSLDPSYTPERFGLAMPDH